MIEPTGLFQGGAGDPSATRPGAGGDPFRLGPFRHQVEAMHWRIEALKGEESGSPEVFQALETTMEEVRVALEELRRTNEALLESRSEVEAERRRYRDLFDLAPDAYIVTDLQGVVREANRAAMAQLNLDPHFLVGKPFFVFLPEEDRPAFRAEISKLRDRAGTSEFDVRLKPRRLSAFDASIRIGVVRDASGQAVALRWTSRDVSARKRAEEEIQALNAQLEGLVVERSEQLDSVLQTNERWLIKAHADDADDLEGPGGRFLRELVEEVDAILWRAEAGSGRYTFVSRRGEELLGYPASRWLDDPDFWLEIIHPEDREFAATYRRKQLRGGLDHEGEYRVVAADGRALWFREAVRVLRRDPEGPTTLYGLMVNISKRKKVERQLYTAKGELASRLRDVSYLHELDGRLAAARGPSATFEEALSGASSLLGAEMAMLWLAGPGQGPPSLAAERGMPDEFVRWVDAGGFAPTLAPGKTLSIEDVGLEPESTAWRPAGRVGGFRAAVIVPLPGPDGEPLGAIVAAFRGAHRPGEGQARLVEMYASRAAEAIEAARALDRIERADRRKADALDAMRTPLSEILALLALPDRAGADEAIGRQVRRLQSLIDPS